MHDGDSLSVILQTMKNSLPAVPPDLWEQLERNLRNDLGGREHFIARSAKRNHLARLEAAMQNNCHVTNHSLAQQLGLSVSRVQQLKRLLRS